MSHALFSRNADLKRLRDDGYFVQVLGGFLVMREVPYVDSQRRLRTGTLFSSLTMAGEETRTPDTHVVYFNGEFPCQPDGSPIQQIAHQSSNFDLGHGLTAKHSMQAGSLSKSSCSFCREKALLNSVLPVSSVAHT